MKRPNDYLPDLMELLDFPEEARAALCEAGKTMTEKHESALTELCARYMEDPVENGEKVFEQLDKIAEDCGIHSYTASLVFLCWNAQELHERYRARGLSEEIFHDTMMDLHYKLAECKQVYGIWGVFTRSWDAGFYNLTRFALGRLQYEFDGFRGESYTAGGFTVKRGDRVLTMHIPSAGPLTKELREDSYRRAYEFYRAEFPNGPVVFTCLSWLLYPPHDGMLPKESNVVSFMHDFDPIFSKETETFHDAWRIYGADAEKSADQLPRKTTFQRAYADWLQSGRKAGNGYGVFLFDGKRFIRTAGCSEHL